MSHDLKTEVKRVNGYLKEVITSFDKSGNIISQTINPLMVELKPRDLFQLFAGSFLIGTPLCLTEEIWTLSTQLGALKIALFGFFSIFTVVSYIYFNFYRYRFKKHIISFFTRVIVTYIVSISSIVLILYLVDKLPANSWLGFKRVVIIGFPTLFGAIISDSLR